MSFQTNPTQLIQAGRFQSNQQVPEVTHSGLSQVMMGFAEHKIEENIKAQDSAAAAVQFTGDSDNITKQLNVLLEDGTTKRAMQQYEQSAARTLLQQTAIKAQEYALTGEGDPAAFAAHISSLRSATGNASLDQTVNEGIEKIYEQLAPGQQQRYIQEKAVDRHGELQTQLLASVNDKADGGDESTTEVNKYLSTLMSDDSLRQTDRMNAITNTVSYLYSVGRIEDANQLEQQTLGDATGKGLPYNERHRTQVNQAKSEALRAEQERKRIEGLGNTITGIIDGGVSSAAFHAENANDQEQMISLGLAHNKANAEASGKTGPELETAEHKGAVDLFNQLGYYPVTTGQAYGHSIVNISHAGLRENSAQLARASGALADVHEQIQHGLSHSVLSAGIGDEAYGQYLEYQMALKTMGHDAAVLDVHEAVVWRQEHNDVIPSGTDLAKLQDRYIDAGPLNNYFRGEGAQRSRDMVDIVKSDMRGLAHAEAQRRMRINPKLNYESAFGAALSHVSQGLIMTDSGYAFVPQTELDSFSNSTAVHGSGYTGAALGKFISEAAESAINTDHEGASLTGLQFAADGTARIYLETTSGNAMYITRSPAEMMAIMKPEVVEHRRREGMTSREKVAEDFEKQRVQWAADEQEKLEARQQRNIVRPF